MRILVIGSCTNEKSVKAPFELTCEDITSVNTLHILLNEKKYAKYAVSAKELYSGRNHLLTKRAVESLRTVQGLLVDFFIISAGFGVLNENQLVIPYNCTFAQMNHREIKERSKKLCIPEKLRNVFTRQYDIIFLLLGRNYILAIADALNTTDNKPLIICFGTLMLTSNTQNLVEIAVNNEVVKSFSQFGLSSYGLYGIRGAYLWYFAKIVALQKDPLSFLTKIKRDKFLIENQLKPNSIVKLLPPNEQKLTLLSKTEKNGSLERFI